MLELASVICLASATMLPMLLRVKFSTGKAFSAVFTVSKKRRCERSK